MGLGGRRPLAGTDDLRGSPHDDVTVGGKPPIAEDVYSWQSLPPLSLLRRWRRPSATARGQCFSCHHANHCPSPRLLLKKNGGEMLFYTLE